MMNFVDKKIVQLEEEVFAKLDETLELMRQYQAIRLEICHDKGMPNSIFMEQTSLQKARFEEIKKALTLEYFMRFQNEMHFESPGACAIIPSTHAKYFTEERCAENLETFKENFFEEIYENFLQDGQQDAA